MNVDDRSLLSFETSFSIFGFILHTLTQISHLNCPWSEKWQRLLSIAFTMVPFLWPWIAPKNYLRHRTNFLVIFRVIYFAFPLLRKARGIQRVLDSPATPGILGFMLDVLKIAWGSRLFAVLTSGLLLHIPIFLHIIVQLYSIYMVLNNNTLCTSPLLSDPTTMTRIKKLNYMTSSVILPNGSVLFGSVPDDKRECTFFLTVLHLIVGMFVTSLPIYFREERDRRRRRGVYGYSNPWGGLIGLWMCLQIIYAAATIAVVST